MGFVEPTIDDLKRVSHMSLLGLLLGMPKMLDRLPAMQRSIKKELERPQLKKLGVAKVFDPIMKPPAINSTMARNTISQLQRVNRAKAWKSTVSLDPDEQFTKTVEAMLVVADQKCKEADEAELALKQLQEALLSKIGLLVDFGGTKYFLNVGMRAINEAVPLTLITMWHEQETRYPAVSKSDYWDVESYTKDAGLVQRLPQLYLHLNRLTTSTLSGARFASMAFGKKGRATLEFRRG